MFLRRDKLSYFQRAKSFIYPKRGLKRAFSYLFLRLKRRPGSPDFIAKGFAIGIFISFTPFIGVHVVGAIACAWIFGGDLIAAAFASLIINAFVTYVILFPLTYRVGKAVMNIHTRYGDKQLAGFKELFHKMWPVHSWEQFLKVTWELFLPMTIGGVVLGIPAALGCYYVVRKAVILFKEQRRLAAQARLKAQFAKAEAEIEHVNPQEK